MRQFFLLMMLWQLIGCSSTAPQIQRYTLAANSSASASEQINLAGGLGVGPIELPEYWRQKEIVVLADENRLLSDPRHLWAGDPKLAISRVITANLGRQLQLNDVWAHPWDTRSKPKKQILLIIESFGGPLGGAVELIAKWRLTDEFGTKVVATERRTFTITSADNSHKAYVAALNEGIDQLSVALGNSVRNHFGEPSIPPSGGQ